MLKRNIDEFCVNVPFPLKIEHQEDDEMDVATILHSPILEEQDDLGVPLPIKDEFMHRSSINSLEMCESMFHNLVMVCAMSDL